MTTSVSQPATDEPTTDDGREHLPDDTNGAKTDDGVVDPRHRAKTDDTRRAHRPDQHTRNDAAWLWLAIAGLAGAVVLAWTLSLLGGADEDLGASDGEGTVANVDDVATDGSAADVATPADTVPVAESDTISSEAMDLTETTGTEPDDDEPIEPVTINEELSLDPITFEVLSATITEDGRAVLDEAAAYLTADPDVLVEIAGHTDSDGEPSANVRLSQARAEAVKAYLEAAGVDGSRMTPVGYGADRPIASNDTDEGKAQNRRIEFVIQ